MQESNEGSFGPHTPLHSGSPRKYTGDPSSHPTVGSACGGLRSVITLSPPRKAVKATLVLLPLLGITYMLFFVNPGEDELSQIVFIYFNSFLQSFQVGLMQRASLTPRLRRPSVCGVR